MPTPHTSNVDSHRELMAAGDCHTGVGSAAEWSQQLAMLDRSNNLTPLIVNHRPVANGIPAISGL